MGSLSPIEFRARFPLLGRRTYVNSCSQGVLSVDVEQAFRKFTDSWHADGSPWNEWIEEVERLRAAFARAIGAHADEIAVVPSASAAINTIASALSFERVRNRVVMGSFEFPTMAQVWLAQRSRGAEIVWVRADGDRLPLTRYAEAIDDRTCIVPATHVCFRNGHKTDIAGLATLCHDRGAYLFLDDYQRTGTGPIDVRALGVDFMVTGCLKYLLGPSGIAFLYVRRDLIERFEPTVTGWFGRINPFAFSIDTLDWSGSARRFESGTPPIPNVFAAQAGLDLLEAIGYEPIEQQIAGLVGRFTEWAHAAGLVVATPTDTARRGPLVVLRCTDAAALVARLANRDVVASNRDDGLRVSFHAYNDTQDVSAVIDALDAEAALLRRTGTAAGSEARR